MDKEMKIAVLIDAENISSKYAQIILNEASSLGTIIYKRIYGNWTTSLLNSWKNELLNCAIQPIQQYSNTIGKNSSDSALIIDAMDLLYQKRLDAFCIVSSDSDFTRLASRLQESEIYVVGMGEQKTPRAFISACSKFVYLDLLYKANNKKSERSLSSKKRKPSLGKQKDTNEANPTAEASSSQADNATTPIRETTALATRNQNTRSERNAPADNMKKSQASSLEEASLLSDKASATEASHDEALEHDLYGNGSDILMMEAALRDIAEEYGSDDGWILSARLGGYLSKRLPDFDTRNFGFRKFVPFVDSLNMFERRSVALAEDPSVKQVSFRLIEE